MSFTFNANLTPEHQNGAFLGTFSAPGYGTVEYSHYFGDKDYFRFDDTKLYLGSNWHGDFETGTIKRYNSETNYTYLGTEGFPIKLTELATGNATWEYIDISLKDIDDTVSVTPVPFQAYVYGATLAELDADPVDTAHFSLTKAWEDSGRFRIDGNLIKLGAEYYFDPQLKKILNSDGGGILIEAYDSIPIPIISYQTQKKDINLKDEIEVSKLFSGVTNADAALVVSPIEFEGYVNGAFVAEINSDKLISYSYSLQENQFLEISNGRLKLKDEFYYDPLLKYFVKEGLYYDSSDADFMLYSEADASGNINYRDTFNISETLDKVMIGDVPYFAGTPVLEKAASGINTIDSLLFSDNETPIQAWVSNHKYSDSSDKTVITYSFIPKNLADQKFLNDYETPYPETDRIIGFDENHKSAARQALEEWAKVANIEFLEVNEALGDFGTIRFGFTDVGEVNGSKNWVGLAKTLSSSAMSGDIWINSNYILESYDQGSSYYFSTLLHEIGHALGLDHPFERTEFSNKSLDFSNYTVMSYTEPENAYYQDAGNVQYLISETPMVYDIAAIQYLYGAAENNHGDTSYKYYKDQPFVEAIWDSDGYDILDLSEFTKDCTISLIPGTYSTIVCSKWTMKDNLGIAQGAILEKVIAGSGNDIITGNSENNHLIGSSGLDVINGGNGNDTIEGGFDNDILYGGRGADQFIFYLGDGRDTLKDFNVNEDEIQFYTSHGQALATNQISLKQNSNGDAVYSTSDGTSVTLEGVSLSSLRDFNRTSVQEKLEELQKKYDALMTQYNESLARIAELEAKLETFTSKQTQIENSPEAIPSSASESLDPEPSATPEPEQQAPTPELTPAPQPETNPSPAPKIELKLAEVENAPTGISKLLVENYGFSWIDGNYYSNTFLDYRVKLAGDSVNTVTVSKVGNQNVFFINGNSNTDLLIDPNKVYRFDQSDVSNTNHPLNFLSEARSDISSFVEVVGTAGTKGAYVELHFEAGDIANIEGPELAYYCTLHGEAMGGGIEITNIIA